MHYWAVIRCQKYDCIIILKQLLGLFFFCKWKKLHFWYQHISVQLLEEIFNLAIL